jgi:hypothetical protein
MPYCDLLPYTTIVCKMRIEIIDLIPMSKRINIVLPEATIQTIDRMAKPGQRSRFINHAVQHYVQNRSTEASEPSWNVPLSAIKILTAALGNHHRRANHFDGAFSDQSRSVALFNQVRAVDDARAGRRGDQDQPWAGKPVNLGPGWQAGRHPLSLRSRAGAQKQTDNNRTT